MMWPEHYQSVARTAYRAALVVALLSGCAHTSGSGAGEPGPRWVDGHSGVTLSDTAARARIAAAPRLVFVAERHADPRYHAVQLDVARQLSAGRTIALGVEWLPVTAQEPLDTWLAGHAPSEALAEAVAWSDVWGHALAAYTPIFLWAREHGVPIIALNAPPGLARAVGRDGPQAVPDDLRRQLPPLNTGNDAHRAHFGAMMAAAGAAHGHGGLSDEALDRYYLAQLVWDETMSATIARHLDTDADTTFVVFAGQGHIDFGHGVPKRAAALTGLETFIVRPATADALPDPGAADLVRIVPAD